MKRILVLALSVLMVLSTFVACSPADGGGDSSAPAGNANTPTTPQKQIGNLDPNINLGEKEVVILSRGHAAFEDEVSVESGGGDPIDQAIYDRNSDVQRILNCVIKNVKAIETTIGTGDTGDAAVIAELKKTRGPDCTYDIVSASAYTAFGNATEALCINLKDVDHLDLTQDYWAPYFNDDATIGNHQYFATGSISLSLRRMIFVTFFNSKITQERNIEDLYDVVTSGRWTLDYQAKILDGVYENSDGVTGATQGDFYGLVTNSHICIDPYWTACDVDILVKNSDDFFEFAPETEKLDSILKKLKDIYKTSHTYAFVGKSGDVDQDEIRQKFTNEEAMMATLRLIEVEAEDFRNMENYGILPMPKFDDAQTEYYSHAHDQFAVYGIVNKDSSDYDDLGAVLECLAIESERTVKDAYFEIALKVKYSKDEQSWYMLDMIVRNLKINGGLLYTPKLGDLLQKLRNAVKNNSPTISATVFNGVHLTSYNQKLLMMQNEFKAIQ